MKVKRRLDTLLVDKGLALSLEEANTLILTGKVLDEKQRPLLKPGMLFEESMALFLKESKSLYVSRAGEKLDHALKTFPIPVAQKVALDIGSSTGGFTDCLIKNGAKHVFAVDVGYGIIHEKLRNHPQVTLLERKNARTLQREDLNSPLSAQIDLLVMDVSFISVEKLIEPLASAFPEIKEWVILFKPQFEVEKRDILEGGVVRNAEVVKNAQNSFENFMTSKGFKLLFPALPSPIAGKKSGNVECLYYYEKTS